MPHRKVTDAQIQTLYNHGWTEAAIVAELEVSLKRVCRVTSGGRSAHDEDDPRHPAPAGPPIELRSGEHTAIAPTARTAEYWAALQLGDGPNTRPRRPLHMVPDDRADEAIDFEAALQAVAKSKRGRRGVA